MTTTTDNQEVAQRPQAAGKISPRTAAWGLARRERKSVMARRPAQEPEVLASKATWRDAAVFAVKLAYSTIFLGIAADIQHIFYPDVTARISPWTGLFLALALGSAVHHRVTGDAFLVSLPAGGIE
jgi:succinate dehydrogenase hydrophobic anchor subunit